MTNNPLGIVIVNDGFQSLHGVQLDLFGELNGFVSEEFCLYYFISSYTFYFTTYPNTLKGFLEKFFINSDIVLVLHRLSSQLNLSEFSHIDVYRPLLMFNIASVIAECNSGIKLSSRVFDIAYSIFFKPNDVL